MAGGFFSGGSSDSVNASVAEAERAAREAEDAIANLTKYTGQTDEDGRYTVPESDATDDDSADTGKFLNQAGAWTVPPGSDSQALTAGDGIEISDTDVISVINPFTDEDETKLDSIADGAEVNRTAAEINNLITKETIDNLDVDAATVTGFTVGVNVPSDAVFTDNNTTYEAGDGLTLTGDIFSRDDIALTGLSDIPTPVASNFLQRNADDDGYVWSASAATVAALTDIGDIPTTIANTVLARNAANDGYEWVVDSDVPYTGSDGITLTDQDFTLTDNGVGADKLNVADDGLATQFLRSDGDGSFTWAIPTDTDTTYTAGTGLDLTGTVFSIPNDGVDTAQIADSAVETVKINDEAVTSDKLASEAATANKIAANAVTTIKIADNAVTAAKLADNSVVTSNIVDANVTRGKIADSAVNESKLEVSNTGASGEFLQSDGDGTFTWAVPAGNGTTYTADGDTLTLTGTEFSVTPGGIDTTELADDAVTTAKIADNAVTSNSIMDDNVGADELNVSGDGTSGQFLSSDGDGTFSWVSGNTTLRGLTDTNIPADNLITDRRFLEYSPSENRWDAVGLDTFLIMSELADVQISNVADNQFLRYNTTDGAWENETVSLNFQSPITAGTGITLTGNTLSVTDDGITTALLANNAVETANINDDAVTSGKIANSAVDTTQLADLAVTTGKIANNAITADQVAANSLGATELASNSVSTFKLQSDSVTTIKITDEAITEPKLNVTNAGTDGQVLSRAGTSFTWIDNGSGGGTTYTADGTTLALSDTNEFSIADDGVDTDQIADNAVTGTQLAAGSVGTTELETDAVETVKINDAAVTTAKINDSAVTNVKLGTGAVNTSKIFDGAITSDKLGSGSVTTVKIGDSQVTNAKVATDIPISKLMDVNTTGALNGQVLTYNGTNWLPMTPSGGGNTDNSRLGIALDTASLNEGDEARTVAITLSIVDGLTDETISGQSVTVTDPTGHTINVDGSGNAFTFSASGTNVGNYVIRASATFTISGNTSVHTSSATLRVIPTPADNINWYQWVTDTQPTAITSDDVVDNGVYNSPETGTWTRLATDTDDSTMAYVALPTGTYTFHAGLLFATITNLGVISTDYTLYRLDDFAQVDPGGNRIITITEA